MTTSRIRTPALSAIVLLLATSGANAALTAGPSGLEDPVGSPVSDVVGTGTDYPGDRTAGPSFSDLAPIEGFDDVRVVIRVGVDGDAEWSVRYRYGLENGSDDPAFESARHNVSNPPGVFVDRMREAARRVERRTGRVMEVQNGTVNTYTTVPHGRFGVVEYRFTWTGFAAPREDGGLVVGDAINGYPVGANESLVVGWSDGLQALDVSPDPNATRRASVRWDGPRKFGVENPRVVLSRTGAAGFGTLPLTPVVLLAIGGALLVAAVAVASVGFGVDLRRIGPGASGETAHDGTESEDEGDDRPSMELLSDQERVLRLLEENGGRMKQQALKEELDWSRTKTSNVVNDMQDEGRIEVYRLGRENTLALPGEMEL